jgi:hypothetical protein
MFAVPDTDNPAQLIITGDQQIMPSRAAVRQALYDTV